MVSMNRIHREIGYSVCRHCICEVYGVHVLTKDCYYDHYPQKCVRCGEMRNIVIRFRISGMLKLLFR